MVRRIRIRIRIRIRRSRRPERGWLAKTKKKRKRKQKKFKGWQKSTAAALEKVNFFRNADQDKVKEEGVKRQSGG